MSENKAQESVLQKVRALLAKAASTEFEGERQVFMQKADELMERYAIDQVMLEHAKDSTKARLVERRRMEINWYYQLKDIDRDARSEIYWLWIACVRHCRCVGGEFNTYERIDGAPVVSVYGIPSDLMYLDLLFTDLMSQMVAKLRPSYDPDKTMGYNIAVAKAAGMKYADIAVWMGREDWVVNGRPVDHGIMARAYKQHVEEHGQDWITVRPGTYQWSFVEGFCRTISSRMYQMRKLRTAETDSTGPMALALRDVLDLAKEELWNDFPNLRPHPEDCQCKTCTAKSKPVKYRERGISLAGNNAGRVAGQNARITQPGERLAGKKHLGN